VEEVENDSAKLSVQVKEGLSLLSLSVHKENTKGLIRRQQGSC
jgi:hypothetical protein